MAMCAATSTTAAAPIAQLRFHEARLHGLRGLREGTARMGRPGVSSFPSTSSSSSLHCLRSNRASKRKTLMCAVDDYAEDSLQKTMGIDRLINMMRDASPKELDKFVVENILSFNEDFWIRLAARTETCKSEDDKKDYEELATTVMSLVDRVVNKTNEKIESSTDILKAIVKPAVPDIEEIIWPPKDPTSLVHMEKELHMREQEGHLDEGFLSEVNAQLRQAKEDGDKPGLEAMLQKVLQLYASKVLSKRSYALKGGEVLKDEYLLESLIKAPSEEWNRMLLEGLVLGKGDVSPDELYAVIKKRKERILMRTEGGSYQQRILGEYLKGIQSRTEEIVQVLEGKQTGDANLGVPKSTDS